MWIAMQMRQQIECSGHTGVFHLLLYIPFWPLKKIALWRWDFHTKIILCSQDIHEWRFTRQILIQIWLPYIARRNIVNQHESLRDQFWSRITKQISKGVCGCRDNWETLCSCSAWGEESRAQNRCLRFARLDVFDLAQWPRALSRSKKSKRGSNAVGGCRDNCETACSWCCITGEGRCAI